MDYYHENFLQCGPERTETRAEALIENSAMHTTAFFPHRTQAELKIAH
jgi:hypothetical protein